ncbi:MAG: 50S ribosomal protein L15 [Patescibacteria group bacterium]
MTLALHNLEKRKGAKTAGKRVGRGYGSGKGGHTSSRGQKGQKSRSGTGGYKRLGMRKLMLATPKLRGFKSQKPTSSVVKLSVLDTQFIKDEVVSPKTLAKKGLIHANQDNVKILSDGEISKSIIVKKCSVSKVAKEKILAAGGRVDA